MALLGSIATVQAQVPRADAFAAAFGYLAELFQPGSPAAVRMKAIAVGETNRIELAGGAFVIEQVYNSKVRADGFFESHRKYIDVQAVFEGAELMEIVDIARAVVRQPYNPERDFIIYEDCSETSALRVGVGEAAVFFPSDVHMPGLCVTREPAVVRKAVVKVPVPA
jgi:YhcH/YjgK/YiaL family protein